MSGHHFNPVRARQIEQLIHPCDRTNHTSIQQRRNLIVTDAKEYQIRQLPERLWDGGNLISTKVKPCQIRQLSERLWNGGNLIVTLAKGLSDWTVVRALLGQK